MLALSLCFLLWCCVRSTLLCVEGTSGVRGCGSVYTVVCCNQWGSGVALYLAGLVPTPQRGCTTVPLDSTPRAPA